MDTEKLMLIINPISGGGKKAGFVEKLSARLGEHGFDVDARLTAGRGDATRLAREAVAKGYQSVAVCGGDGTVNEAARAMMGTGVAMGIIPSGSGNGLARHFGIPVDEFRSVDVIGARHTIISDCGQVNGTPFFCTFGLGFDANTAHRFAKKGKRGKITYLKSMIEEYRQYHPTSFEITINGETTQRDAYMLTVCNASQYGNNAFIAPEASVHDGLLDTVLLKSCSAMSILQAGLDIFIGMTPHNSHFELYKSSEITIKHPGTNLAHIDGEPITIDGDAVVKCLPAQLKVYYHPRSERQFTPIISPIEHALRDWGLAIEKLFRKD